MLFKEVLEIYELIDRPGKVVSDVVELIEKEEIEVRTERIKGDQGETDFIRFCIPGEKGKTSNGEVPTLGVIGRLGGVGARPAMLGLVSDGEGALSALSVGLKLARMRKKGDVFAGDVIVATHLCTDAPVWPHEPVPFMGSPVELSVMNDFEVASEMDAILSIDVSRGNKIINVNGFAISPTVKEGWILRVSDDLLRIMEQVTGSSPAVVPITMQDITPYGNDVYHFNSLLQPAVATSAPVVGIALTSELPVPGCGTGVSNPVQVDQVGRFVIECVQAYSQNSLKFYDPNEFEKLVKLYGEMKQLQTMGQS